MVIFINKFIIFLTVQVPSFSHLIGSADAPLLYFIPLQKNDTALRIASLHKYHFFHCITFRNEFPPLKHSTALRQKRHAALSCFFVSFLDFILFRFLSKVGGNRFGSIYALRRCIEAVRLILKQFCLIMPFYVHYDFNLINTFSPSSLSFFVALNRRIIKVHSTMPVYFFFCRF